MGSRVQHLKAERLRIARFQNGRRKEAWICGELHAGRCGCWSLQDCRRPHREDQAARPEPGRDDQAGPSGQALQGNHRLHPEGSRYRGSPAPVERQPGQRAPVLPHAGTQLCFQGLHQGSLRMSQDCRPGTQVRHQHRLRWSCWNDVSAVCLLSRLRQFNGLVDVYVKTLKSDGIQGLYRGFAISAVGIFIYRGMYFGLFDTLKPILVGKDGSLMASFLLGWAVTVTAGLISYPIDTIRRRMMMTSGGGVKYNGSFDCARQIMANGGFMSMMKGAGANVLRGVAGAGVLAGFDKFQSLYIQWRTGAQVSHSKETY